MSASRMLAAAVGVAGLACTGAVADFGLPADLDFSWTGTISNPGSENPLLEWRANGDYEAPQAVGSNTWRFPNVHIPDNIKNLYIYVDWGDQAVPDLTGLFTVTAPTSSVVQFQGLTGNNGDDNNAFLWHWTIDPQPDWEKITFNNLSVMPATFTVGTKCVIPEPATFGLLTTAGLVALRRRR